MSVAICDTGFRFCDFYTYWHAFVSLKCQGNGTRNRTGKKPLLRLRILLFGYRVLRYLGMYQSPRTHALEVSGI